MSAFSNLAKESNTILLPSNTGDISGMVSQVCLLSNSPNYWIYMLTASKLLSLHAPNDAYLVFLPLRL